MCFLSPFPQAGREGTNSQQCCSLTVSNADYGLGVSLVPLRLFSRPLQVIPSVQGAEWLRERPPHRRLEFRVLGSILMARAYLSAVLGILVRRENSGRVSSPLGKDGNSAGPEYACPGDSQPDVFFRLADWSTAGKQ